jgi:hypothetical protein
MTEIKIRAPQHEAAAARFVARMLDISVSQAYRTGGLSYFAYFLASIDESDVSPEHLEELRAVREAFVPLWSAALKLAKAYDLNAE